MIGIFLAKYFDIPSIHLFFLIIFLLLFTLLSYMKHWPLTTILLFTLWLLIGIFNVNLNNKPPENNHIANYVHENKITLIATVLDQQTDIINHRAELKVKANYVENKGEKIKVKGFVLVRIFNLSDKYGLGDIIRIKGYLKRPFKKNNFGDFDYELYLAQKHIYVCLDSWEGSNINKVGQEKMSPFVSIPLKAREKIKNILVRKIPEPYHYLLLGMMLGEKRSVPQEWKDFFTDAGVMHVLAVSGLHVGMMAGFLLLVFGWFNVTGKKRYISVLLLLLFYAALTGFRPSVSRATIMFSLLIIGRLINRNRDVYISLFFAAFVILLLNPLTIYDSGFILSFFVTFFIIYLMPVIKSTFSTRFAWFDNACSLSIAAWLGLFPLSAYFFQKVSIIALIANLIIIPLAGITVLMGFLTVCMGSLYLYLANIPAFISFWLLKLMVILIRSFSSLPLAFIYIGQPSTIAIVLYYSLIIVIAEIIDGWQQLKKYKGKMVIISIFLLFIILSFYVLFPENKLEVHFINVGEGDCILLKVPNHLNILIDGGGTPGSEFDVGKKIVIPYLRREGINKLDAMVLSHPHLDHMEGLLSVLKEFNIGLVIDSRINYEHPRYQEFLSIIHERKIPYYQVSAGDLLKINQFSELYVFNPVVDREMNLKDNDLNNASIVLKLLYKNSSFLFTGDVEKEAERRMLLFEDLLKSDILKIAHHGSESSTDKTFLKKVNPLIAVILTGKNSFGHPSDIIIQRLEGQGIKVFRTDVNGTIIIKTDGNDYSVNTSGRYNSDGKENNAL